MSDDLRKTAASYLLRHLARGADERRADIRRQIRKHEAGMTPRFLRPLPYSHALGPSGNPKTFGIAGGGNRSGSARRGSLALSQAEQDRRFENERRQRSRIDANGGQRRPAHRPRSITAEKEQRVLDLLMAGVGIKRAARLAGVGVSGAQRIKREGYRNTSDITDRAASIDGTSTKEEAPA